MEGVLIMVGIIGGTAVLVWLCWMWARGSASAYNFMGFGTNYIGRTKTPSGHITTKWIVFMFMPVVPVRSLEIMNETVSAGSTFTNLEKKIEYKDLPHIYWRQVIFPLVVVSLFWILIVVVLAGSVAYPS